MHTLKSLIGALVLVFGFSASAEDRCDSERANLEQMKADLDELEKEFNRLAGYLSRCLDR